MSKCDDINESNDSLELNEIIPDGGSVVTRSVQSSEEAIEAAKCLLNESVDAQADPKLIVLQVNALIEPLSSDELGAFSEVASQCFVVAIQSAVDGKFCVVWRSQTDLYAHTMFENIKRDDLIDLCPFVVDFLGECLRNNHSGIASDQAESIDKLHVYLSSLNDRNGLNLFFNAVQGGHTKIVEILLTNAVSDVNRFRNGRIASDHAYENGHFDVLLVLLHSNSMFPRDFAAGECPDAVREFAETSLQFHEHIRCGNLEEIRAFIAHHPNLRFIFDPANRSAAAAAIGHKQFAAYELLAASNLYFSTNEELDRVMADLTDEERAEVRDVHFRLKKDIQEQYVTAVMAKCFVGHDEFDVQDKLNRIGRAFRVLNGCVLIQILLKIAAVLADLQIVFDFNRDSVHHLDPTQGKNVHGLFYGNGRIYIGARQLLDESVEFETFATIAHELCHYVLFVVFDNLAKPYRAMQTAWEREFADISSECCEKSHIEEIIGVVYDPEVYLPENRHAELIVRVPHLLAHYFDCGDVVAKLRADFNSLFTFYESRVVPELEAALVELREKAENEVKREVIEQKRKISILIRVFGVVLVIVTGIAILVGFLLYEPTYSWSTLSEAQKGAVFDGNVRFEGREMKFRDLYGVNESSGVFGALNSPQIRSLLNGELLDLSEHQNGHLELEIYLTFDNLTEDLREKVMGAEITFQGEKVRLDLLLKNKTRNFLNLLNSKETLELLKNQSSIEIGHKLENASKVYVERRFIDYRIDIYKKCLKRVQNIALPFECYNDDEKRNFSITSTALLAESEKRRFVLLSSDAGMGKSTVFKNFAQNLKRKYPLKWVEYVDLKSHTFAFEKYQNFTNQNALNVLTKVFDGNDKEAEVLSALYEAGHVIILWDGYDEISPTYSNFTVGLMSQIKNKTRNIQFLSMRSHYQYLTRYILNCTVYKFFPYGRAENEEFLGKFYTSKNLTEMQMVQAKERVAKIIEKVQKPENFEEFRDYVEVPLMLQMIAEVSVDTDSSFDATNLYTTYESFLLRQIAITGKKGEIAQTERENILVQRKFNLIEVFQYFAIKFLFEDYTEKYDSYSRLKIVRKFRNKLFDATEWSRYGIVTLDSVGGANFVHRTFAEFFVTQYFVDNVYNVNDEPTEDEARTRLDFMFRELIYEQRLKIFEFISDYVYAFRRKMFHYEINQMFKVHYPTAFYSVVHESKDTGYSSQYFQAVLGLFVFKSTTLEVLWKLGNETTFFNWWVTEKPRDFVASFDKIQRLIAEFFAKQTGKQRKLLYGENQRGNLVYTAYRGLKRNGISELEVHQLFKFMNVTLDFDPMHLNEFQNFTSFYKFAKPRLTRAESRQLFATNFQKLSINEDSSFWDEMKQVFSVPELQQIIYTKTVDGLNVLQYTPNLSLTNHFLTALDGSPNTRFFELLYGNHGGLLFDFKALMQDDNFEIIWAAIAKRVVGEEKRKILTSTMLYSSFNFFTASVDYGSLQKFETVKNVYAESFSTAEMQAQCVEYFEIWRTYHIWSPHVDTVEAFDAYIRSIFTMDEIKHRLRQLFIYRLREKGKNGFPFKRLLSDTFTTDELANI